MPTIARQPLDCRYGRNGLSAAWTMPLKWLGLAMPLRGLPASQTPRRRSELRLRLGRRRWRRLGDAAAHVSIMRCARHAAIDQFPPLPREQGHLLVPSIDAERSEHLILELGLYFGRGGPRRWRWRLKVSGLGTKHPGLQKALRPAGLTRRQRPANQATDGLGAGRQIVLTLPEPI